MEKIDENQEKNCEHYQNLIEAIKDFNKDFDFERFYNKTEICYITMCKAIVDCLKTIG
jgi:hypothetical protein